MKILIIRFFYIGDVVMTSVLCDSLKRSLPGCQVDYLMYEAAASLFENHPNIDNVITVSASERKNPFKYLRKILRISRNNYDIIIDTTSTAKSELVSLLSHGAEYRIGRFKKGRGYAYTHLLSKQELSGNKIQQRLKMLEPLKKAGLPIVEDPQMRLYPTEQECAGMRACMVSHGVDFARPVIAFAVSSRETEKRWREDYMLALVQHCLDRHKAQIVFFAGLPYEQAMIDSLHEQSGGHKDIFSRIPSPSLRSLLPLFANCNMFVGNEGGPRHLAHAVGLPTVSVFSPIAERDEWQVGDPARHKGISWRDMPVNETRQQEKFEYGDSTYFELYDSIELQPVITLVDEVFLKFGSA